MASKIYGLNSSHDPFVGVSGYLVGYSDGTSGFEQDARARHRIGMTRKFIIMGSH